MSDIPLARSHLYAAQASIDAALAALEDDAPEPVPPSDVITTPEALDAALLAAAPDDVLTLALSLRYPGMLTLAKPVTLQAELLPLDRVTADVLLPTFLGGVCIPGDDVTILGAEIRHSDPHAYDIVQLGGARTTLDRVRVLGDPAVGDKRGIAANGGGDCIIRDCYVDDCFGPYPGNDCQAVCAWDMAPGLLIENCFLRGGTETIMLGGSDSSSEARMPTDVTIRGCDITKRPEWQTQAVSVKNTVEIKAGRRIRIEDNRISYSWGGKGQDGYLLVLSVRNQSGGAPWSTIDEVWITNNHFAHGAAAINILGRDNNEDSGQLTSVLISGNTFEDLDPITYTGDKRMILCGGGSQLLTICENQFAGAGMTSVVYFYGPVPANLHYGMMLAANVFPSSKYGIFGEDSSTAKPGQVPPAWERYVVDGTLEGNVVAGA
jgi:hypothetical protein